jgi:ankyrin repeat protein
MELVFASAENRDKDIRRLVNDEGFNVDGNPQDNDEHIPLHAAARGGQIRAMEQLRKLGADLNILDTDGNAAAHFVAVGGHTKAAEALVEWDVDWNVINGHGEAPIHLACSEGHLGVVKLLIEQPAVFLSVESEDGWSCLHWASAGGHDEIVAELADAVPTLVEAGDIDGQTPIVWAVRDGHVSTVRTLVEVGASIHATGANRSSLLESAMLLAEKQYGEVSSKRERLRRTLEMVTILVEHGADVNMKYIQRAVEHKLTRVADLLVHSFIKTRGLVDQSVVNFIQKT